MYYLFATCILIHVLIGGVVKIEGWKSKQRTHSLTCFLMGDILIPGYPWYFMSLSPYILKELCTLFSPYIKTFVFWIYIEKIYKKILVTHGML